MTIFKELKLDIVVMEVSMGGRLDATIAIPGDSVVVSTLTSVGLDHQEFFGNMVAEREGGDCEESEAVCVGETKIPRG